MRFTQFFSTKHEKVTRHKWDLKVHLYIPFIVFRRAPVIYRAADKRAEGAPSTLLYKLYSSVWKFLKSFLQFSEIEVAAFDISLSPSMTHAKNILWSTNAKPLAMQQAHNGKIFNPTRAPK